MRPTGAILWRLDANGNLTAYDKSGTVLGLFVGTVFSTQANGASITGTVDVATTSTSYISTGLGVLITPRYVQSQLVLASFGITLSGAGTGFVGLVNSTTIPALNAAATGSLVAEFQSTTTTVSTGTFNMRFNAGLALGVQQSYYLALKSSVGTVTVTLKAFAGANGYTNITVMEI
jgi:hypothetical protein